MKRHQGHFPSINTTFSTTTYLSAQSRAKLEQYFRIPRETMRNHKASTVQKELWFYISTHKSDKIYRRKSSCRLWKRMTDSSGFSALRDLFCPLPRIDADVFIKIPYPEVFFKKVNIQSMLLGYSAICRNQLSRERRRWPVLLKFRSSVRCQKGPQHASPLWSQGKNCHDLMPLCLCFSL